MADHPNLVEQALGNLVKQFANPMDCLRELVQNSIDAGTPRIEIEVRFTEKEDARGVFEIEVSDFGQGMDAAIIDTQLTRLFSSAKEGDLGSIGKFGIGFTSVFAIEPALVRVLTGRHGENWEILFHEDRSFERRPYDGPVQGTTITLYKRLRTVAVEDLVENARSTLIRWCEHAETPITFRDATQESPAPADPDADPDLDPFGSFAAGPANEPINRPFEIEDSPLQLHHADGDVQVVIGVSEDPSWGFFSGGLTLLRTEDPGHLGRYHGEVGHFAFKVRSRRIEHTLTRDNVIQDDAWYEAMDVVVAAGRRLRSELEGKIEAVARAGGEVGEWHGHLARDVVHQPLPWDVPLFVDFGGRARTLAQVAPLGPFGREAWLVHARDEALGKALWNKGIKVLRHHPYTRQLLELALEGSRVDDAAEAFAVTRPVELDALRGGHRAVFEIAASHLGVATGNSVKLGVCDIEGADGGGATLFVEGRAREGLMRRPARRGVWGAARRALMQFSSLMLFQRWVLVNRAHPHVRRLMELALDDPELAGFALAQAVMVEERMYDEDNYDALATRASREWLRDV